MDVDWKEILWRQFGAAIDMLENALLACPDELWGDRSRRPEFWYLVYHTLFFLDFYLSDSVEGFSPPAPFTLDEMDPDAVPERAYTKDELRSYLEHGRAKCRATIAALTDETARRRREFSWGETTGAELLLYNLRHVQHHAAQLNLILRQTTDSAPRWVAKARSSQEELQMLRHRIEVSLRDFGEADRPLLDEWARRIDSTTYMSRYAPKAGQCLLWCVIEAQGTDVGTVWLERAAEPDGSNLGILLGDPGLFGQGIGRRAINLAIAKACTFAPLRLIRLHVRHDNGRAIACYEHCGFRVVGSGTREAGGREYGFFVMEKRLDDESAA